MFESFFLNSIFKKTNPQPMKHYFTILSLFLLVCTLAISGCGGGDDEPATPAEEEQLAKLVGNWSLESAALGSDNTWTVDFEGLELELSGVYEEGGTYDYAFSIDEWPINSPWPENGEWKFGATSGDGLETEFVRLDDGQEMTYSVTDTELTFTFSYSGDGFQNSKTSSVEGNWVFVFTKP